MRINKIGRSKVEVVEGEKRVVVDVHRVGRNFVVTLSDGENARRVVVRDIASPKLIREIDRMGISDAPRLLSYLQSMSEVKMVEAEKCIFMKVEDVVRVETGEVVDRIIETYYHTADGWRVFTSDGELREVHNIAVPSRSVLKAVMHYNTPDVSKDVVYEISHVAKELREVVEQYVVLEEKYYDVATAWIMGTYLRWAAPYSELLIIRKPGFGAGGTTLLKTVSALSARPLLPSVSTSSAAFYRVVDFLMPTMALDEIREDEIQREKLAELKLMAESAFDKWHRVYRVIEGEVEVFSTFSNVVVVDSTDRFTTYSAERRAWTVVVREAQPQRLLDIEELLSETATLREKLYALGVALPTLYYDPWRKLTKEQGLGVLRFLARAAQALGGDASIFESALYEVERQLQYARQTALITDPKRMIVEMLQRIIEDAKRELEMAATSPSNAAEYISIVTPEDPEYKCGVIYLQRLVRELRRRFMEVVQVDTRKLDSIYYTTSEVRYWFRVNPDVEMYLRPAKIKALLTEMGIMLELDQSRNYYIRMCRTQ
jgi:hypothetical protein